jgi:hypothetical protein
MTARLCIFYSIRKVRRRTRMARCAQNVAQSISSNTQLLL